MVLVYQHRRQRGVNGACYLIKLVDGSEVSLLRLNRSLLADRGRY